MPVLLNIENANVIETSACWLALSNNRWKPDARSHGVEKLQDKTDPVFSKVLKRRFYVSRPLLMATLQPLTDIGLARAKSVKFNAFACAPHARNPVFFSPMEP